MIWNSSVRGTTGVEIRASQSLNIGHEGVIISMTQRVSFQRIRAGEISWLRLIGATVLAVVAAGAFAIAAHAGTDSWCGCSVSPGDTRRSPYDHHFTLVYVHDVTVGAYETAYLGAGVDSCYSVAHAVGVVTHSYGTPCLSYARGYNANNPDNAPSTLNMHGDY
jgi:hypothetical protein